MTKQEIKKYLYQLRPYILFAGAIFTGAVFVGYFTAQNFPGEVARILEEIKKELGPLGDATNFELFLIIFEQNVFALLLSITLGIFLGIIPCFSVFTNGLVLGIITFEMLSKYSWEILLAGILPHGIIEIPVLIISSAIGIKIGKTVLWKIFKRQGSVKKEFKQALKFFFNVLLPLLFLAALIEAFITTALLSFYVD
jgi:stage II sporulation protein M